MQDDRADSPRSQALLILLIQARRIRSLSYKPLREALAGARNGRADTELGKAAVVPTLVVAAQPTKAHLPVPAGGPYHLAIDIEYSNICRKLCIYRWNFCNRLLLAKRHPRAQKHIQERQEQDRTMPQLRRRTRRDNSGQKTEGPEEAERKTKKCKFMKKLQSTERRRQPLPPW